MQCLENRAEPICCRHPGWNLCLHSWLSPPDTISNLEHRITDQGDVGVDLGGEPEPFPKELLYAEIHVSNVSDACRQRLNEGKLGELVAEVQERREAPVHGAVPHGLQCHDSRIAEERVLIVVREEIVLKQRQKNVLKSRNDVLQQATGEAVHNHLCDYGVADGNEITTWRIQWIGQHAGLTNQRPPFS